MSYGTRTMLGEFRADVTRETFRPDENFLRVITQQGRVAVDANVNEQVSIFLHYVRSLAADLMGPHGGAPAAFEVSNLMQGSTPVANDFQVTAGRYYVDGILCERATALQFGAQPGGPFPDSAAMAAGNAYLVFLDVWERHVTYLQDDYLREVALRGPDTATRAQVVAQVKLLPMDLVAQTSDLEKAAAQLKAATTDAAVVAARKAVDDAFAARAWPATNGTLRARAAADQSDEPCTISPDSRYRGAANQLYRVEIHDGGTANADGSTTATFKWSRDNGSVVFPIREWAGGDTVKVANLGRDDTSRLRSHDWVEVVDDTTTLRGAPGPLYQVVVVHPDEMTVTLDLSAASPPRAYTNADLHPLLRRWDQSQHNGTLSKGAIPVRQGDGTGPGQWVGLEDGVQIQFPSQSDATYRPGDYWLIPARTATGDVEWPVEKPASGDPIHVALPPDGIAHRYGPLALISLAGDGTITDNRSLRHVITRGTP